jgi:branched-chain amino acid transport system substrate-binding protein
MENTPSTLLNGQVIQMAAAAPLSGKAAPLGKEMIQAISMAVEEQNKAGGIMGATVQLITADDEADVQKGIAVARQFCAAPQLLGIVGHYNSDVTMAAIDIYRQAGLALISPIASNPQLTEGGLQNVFRLTNRDDHTGAAIADHLYATAHKRNAVVVWTATAYGQSMAHAFIQAFTHLGGNIVFQRSIPEEYQDFYALVHKFPEEHDLLFYGGYNEGAPLLLAYRELEHMQLFAAGDGCWDVVDFLDPVGNKAETGEGVLILSASPEIGRVPGSEVFRKQYEQRYGRIINYAVNSYDAARVLIAAIKNAAVAKMSLPGPVDVAVAMRKIVFHGICYQEPVQWDEKGDNTGAVTALHVVKNGQYRQIAEVPQDPVGV